MSIKSTSCRIPTAFDREFADYMNWMPPLASTLRGMYEESHIRPKDITDDEYYGLNYRNLKEYYENLNEQERKQLSTAILGRQDISYANAYHTVVRKFGSIKQVNDITRLFRTVFYSMNTLVGKYLDNGSLNGRNILADAIEAHDDLKAIRDSVNKEILAKNEALQSYIYTKILTEAIRRNYLDLQDVFKQMYDVVNIYFDTIASDERSAKSIVTAINKYKSMGELNFGTFLWMIKDDLGRKTGIKFGKKGKYIEYVEADDNTQELLEESVLEGWQKKIDKSNPFDDARETVRFFLSVTPLRMMFRGQNKSQINPLTPRARIYAEPTKTYNKIMRIVRDSATQDDMMNYLRNSHNPTISYIVEALDASPRLKQAFFRDFNKVRQDYVTFNMPKAFRIATNIYRNFAGLFKPVSTAYEYEKKLRMPTNSKVQVFTERNKIMVRNYDNWAQFAEYVRGIIDDNRRFHTEETDLDKAHADFITKVANDYLGLHLNKNVINILASDEAELFQGFINCVYNLATMPIEDMQEGKVKTVQDIFSKGNEAVQYKRLFQIINQVENESTMTVRVGDSNYAKDTQVNELGSIINKLRAFKKNLSQGSSSIVDFHNWIKNEYLVSTEYVDDKEIFHDWVNELYNTKAEDFEDPTSFVNQFLQSGIRVLQIKDGYRDIDVVDMNESQNMLTFMQAYFAESKESGGKYADYNMFTMGDSNVIKFIRGKVYTLSDLRTQYANVAMMEMHRMRQEALAKKNLTKKITEKGDEVAINTDVDTITNSADELQEDGTPIALTGKFVYLRGLNPYISDLRKALSKSEDIFKQDVIKILFGGTTSEGRIISKEQAVLYNEFIEDFWKDINPLGEGKYRDLLRIQTKVDENKGVYSEAEENVVFENFPPSIISVSDVFEGGKLVTKVGRSKYSYEKGAVKLDNGNKILMYWLNGKLAQIQEFQFFKKNPDNYIKGGKPSAVTQQKRAKALNTPGIHCNIDAEWDDGTKVSDGIERVIYWKEAVKSLKESDEGLWDELHSRKLKGLNSYDKIKTSDGQGRRTLSSYRKVMKMLDNWGDDCEAAYNKVTEILDEIRPIIENALQEGRKLTEEEDHSIAQKIDIINDYTAEYFQPIKPHLSGYEKQKIGNDKNDSDVMFIAVEHKYAEAIVIPEIEALNGNMRMYYLGKYMNENNIDLACSEECVKVGNWGTTEIMYNTDENGFYNGETERSKDTGILNPTEITSKLENAVVHEFSYADYEVQTEVPQHLDTEQLIGTQMRKQILTNILKEGNIEVYSKILGQKLTTYYIGSKPYSLNTKEDLLKFYNVIVSSKMLDTFMNLAEKLSDVNKLSDVLSDLKTNDITGTPSAIRKYAIKNGKFVVPLSEPTQAYDNETSIMSLLKKGVNKQKIKGGSFVQVSDFGYNNELKTHVINGKITYADCIATWDLSVNIDGKQTPLRYSDYCHADGTLIEAKDSKGNIIKDENGETVTKVEQEYPGILDKIAYRIPTSRMGFMFKLKVKRFLPKCYGGILIMPPAYMVAAGFDFDIDKLYTFKREYNVKMTTKATRSEANKNVIKNIWNKIYEEPWHGRKLRDVLKEYQDLDANDCKEIADKLFRAEENGEKKKYSIQHIMKDKNLREKFKSFLSELNKQEEENAKKTGTNAYHHQLRKQNLFEYMEEATGQKHTNVFQDYIANHPQDALALDKTSKEPVLQKIDVNKNVNEWSIVDKNNMFFDLVSQLLESNNSFKSRFTPGEFADAKRASKALKAIFAMKESRSDEKYSLDDLKDVFRGKKDIPDYDIDYDPTNPLTSAVFNTRNEIADKVIGIMANWDTNFAYSQVMSKFELQEPVKLFGKEVKDLIHNPDAGEWLSQLLDSSVDAVKDPILNFLNINIYTANIAALLSRLGYNAFEVGIFLNQPIIKRLCDYMSNNGMGNMQRAMKALIKEYTQEKGVTNNTILKKEMNSFDENLLYNQLFNEDARTQLQILNTLNLLCSQAQALSEFISETKYTAANSIDNTLGSIISLEYKKNSNIMTYLTIDIGNNQKTPIDRSFVDKILNKSDSQKTVDAMFGEQHNKWDSLRGQRAKYLQTLMENPFAFEQTMHDCIDMFMDVMSKYFPYKTTLYHSIYNIIANNIISGDIDAKVINVINSNLPAYMLTTMTQGHFNPKSDIIWLPNGYFRVKGETETVSDDYNITSVEKYFKSNFPKKLRQFKDGIEKLRGSLRDFYAIGNDVVKARKNILNDTSIDSDLLEKRTKLLQIQALKNSNNENKDARIKDIEEELGLKEGYNLDKEIKEAEKSILSYARENELESFKKYNELRNKENQLEDDYFNKQDKFAEEFSAWANLTPEEVKGESDEAFNSRNEKIDALLNNTFLLDLNYNTSVEKDALGNETDYVYSFYLTNNNQFDKDFKGTTSSGWAELANISPHLATGLYLMNFFKRGFEVGTNVFNNITPIEVLDLLIVKDGISYLQWVESLNKGVSQSNFKINNFLSLFYRNNYDNYKLVQNLRDLKIDGKTTADTNGIINTVEKTKYGCTVSSKSLENSVFAIEGSYMVATDGTKTVRVLPAFTINDYSNGEYKKRLFVYRNPSVTRVEVGSVLEYYELSLNQERTISYSESVLQLDSQKSISSDARLENAETTYDYIQSLTVSNEVTVEDLSMDYEYVSSELRSPNRNRFSLAEIDKNKMVEKRTDECAENNICGFNKK